MKKLILTILFLLISIVYAENSYNADVIGEGSIDSHINFNDLGTDFRTSEGEFGIGIQLKETSLFSGAELCNSSDGTYRSWGKIGGVSHSISLSNVQKMYGTSTFNFEDGINETTGSFVSGQSQLNITYIGYGVEKVREVTENNKPLEIGTTRANGTITITSGMVI